MKKIKRIISCVLSISMMASFMPPDIMKLAGIETKTIYCEVTEDSDYIKFKDYANFVVNELNGPWFKENEDCNVWSAQYWFNYKYGKLESNNNIFSPTPDEDRTGYYKGYICNDIYYDSYTNMEIDPSNRYDTMYALRCALQVELLYHSNSKDITNGNYLTIDEMYSWSENGEKLNYFGSFGEKTRAAFDQMISDYGGLSKLPSDVIRIINYGLVVKGYGGLCSDGSLPYASGTIDDNVKSGIAELLKQSGVKDYYQDIDKDFDSVLLKAILNTDSYKTYDNGDDKVRDLQILLNKKIYDNYTDDGYGGKQLIGIGPCDGVYGRDTCERLIYYYQKLIFEGTDIEPNGYFGEGTLKYSPEISSDYNNKEILNIVKYAYYINGYDPGIGSDSYSIVSEQAAKKYKSFMHLPNSDDGVTYSDTIKSLLSSSGDINRTALACDTNTRLTPSDIQKLKENGYEYVGRYVVDERFEKKRLTEQEAHDIIDAGLKIIPIYQGFNCGDPDDFNVIKAQKDAVDSMNAAVNIGIPKGSTLYFAVDCDPYDEEIEKYVLVYFKELKRILTSYGNLYEIGVYGTRNVCKTVYDSGYAKFAYVADASTGFSGNMGFKMPECWAFDQFRVSVKNDEIYVGSVQIDKVAVSGIDGAVIRLDKNVQTEYEIRKEAAPKMSNFIMGNMYGDPVNLANGAHEIEYTAVSVSGAQNIDFSLSYSSAELTDGESGTGWYHNYEKHLEFYTETYPGLPSFGCDENGNPLIEGTEDRTVSYVNVYDSPVSCVRYTEINSNEFVPENPNYKGYTLNKQDDNSWVLNCNNEKIYYYDSNGKLSGIKNKEGLLIKIEDTDDKIIITETVSGKKITAVKKDGKISSVYSDEKQGVAEFTYSDGLLTTIKDINGYEIKYTYDETGRVTSGTDGDGITFFTDTYYDDKYFEEYSGELGLDDPEVINDSEKYNALETELAKAKKAKYGKIKTQTDAIGNTSYFDYSESYDIENDICNYYFSANITDRNGNSTVSVFNERNMLIRYTDQNGDTTLYDYDSSTCDLLTVTDPSGLSEKMEYDDKHNLISKTDKNGLVTEYVYDENNNITESVFKDKNGTEYSRVSYKYADNLMTQMTDSRGITTDFIYKDGLLSSKIVNSSSDDKRIYTYSYKDGLLESSTDPCGGKVITNHNSNGLIESYTDAEGNKIKSNIFDKSGNIISENIYYSKEDYNTIIHSFNSSNLEISQSDSISNIYENTYNGNGKLTSVKDGKNNKTVYDYDNEDRLISVTDAEGNVIKNEYDAGGRIVKELNEDNIEKTYEYNSAENTVKIILGKVTDDKYEIYNIITTKYDGYGNILWQKDSYDTITEYKYNSRHLLSEIIYAKDKDEETRETYEYNDFGDLISVTDGEGNVCSYEYDELGNRISFTDANGNKTVYTYDKCGRLKTEANAVMAKAKKCISYEYDKNGRVISVTSPSGYVTKNTYDFQGNLLTTTDPLGRISTTKYDLRGNVSELINPNQTVVSSYKYDNNNILTEESDAIGNVKTYTYDKAERLNKITDPAGNITAYSYDKSGNIMGTTDSAGTSVTAEYDALGNCIKTSDGNYTDAAYQYDMSGNLIAKPSTGGKSVEYGYNALNLCTEKINGRNQKTKYSYDKAGRIIKSEEYDEEGNITNLTEYTYDSNGNILFVKDNSGTITRTFDELNRVTSYTDTFGETIKYSYDIEGNLIKIDYPDDADKKIYVKYEYDKAAQLNKVTDWENNTTEYTYDVAGQLSAVKKPDGSVITYEYDDSGNLLYSDDRTENDIIASYSYRYDENSNLIREESSEDNIIYTMNYDVLNRLLCRTATDKQTWFDEKVALLHEIVSYNGKAPEALIMKLWSYDTGTTTRETFGYDTSGNIRSFSRTINEDGVPKTTSLSRSYYYGENNKLLRYTENNGISLKNPITSILLGIIPSYIGNILQYDDDGNLISSVNGENSETYTYNSKNNLTSCSQTEYTYDAEGNRIKISEGENETRYLYDTNQSLPKVIKRTQNGVSTIYVYGKELISEKTDDETSYYHFDYRGSTVALTDKNGKITDKYQYDVYGNSRHTEGESDTPFRYNGSAGVMTDANNLLYMKSRYYDPEILRFISTDILTGDIRNTQSLNRYAYCEGNPVSFTDPFGLSREIKLQKQEQIEAAKREQISDKIHGTLDIAGMTPVIGMAADGLNGVIYIFEGDLVGASFSAVAFIPVIGEVATPSKYGGKLVLATASSGADNVFRMAGKRGDDAAELIINKSDNLIDDFAKEPFLPDEFYTKHLPKQVSPGTTSLPKYDEYGNLKQTKYYDSYGREIMWIDYTDHGRINHTAPHWHEMIYNSQYPLGVKIDHRMDPNVPIR